MADSLRRSHPNHKNPDVFIIGLIDTGTSNMLSVVVACL
jgi:hypothetical protein